MKAKLSVQVQNAKWEVETITVKSELVIRTEKRRKKDGWSLRGKRHRQDGKVDMTFERKSVGSVEVQGA